MDKQSCVSVTGRCSIALSVAPKEGSLIEKSNSKKTTCRKQLNLKAKGDYDNDNQ
jgi:hypothetical protein